MKKISHTFASLMILLLIAGLLAGCGASGETPSAEPAEEPTEEPAAEEPTAAAPLLGAWRAEESFALTDETRAVFDKAVEGLTGVGYEPVACLASQAVAGTNRAYLCRARVVYPDAKPYYAIVYVYENLDGGAEVLDILGLGADGQPDENAGSAAPLAGGWYVPDSDEDALTAFESARQTLLGVDYAPVAVIGQQLVSGSNFRLLCRAKAVAPDAQPYYCYVTVYRDLQDNIQVTDVAEWAGPEAP